MGCSLVLVSDMPGGWQLPPESIIACICIPLARRLHPVCSIDVCLNYRKLSPKRFYETLKSARKCTWQKWHPCSVGFLTQFNFNVCHALYLQLVRNFWFSVGTGFIGFAFRLKLHTFGVCCACWIWTIVLGGALTPFFLGTSSWTEAAHVSTIPFASWSSLFGSAIIPFQCCLSEIYKATNSQRTVWSESNMLL